LIDLKNIINSMPFLFANIAGATTGFTIKGMMRYNVFVPRLYNFCKSFGF